MLNCFLFSRVRWEDWYQPRVCVFSAAAESGCVELNVNTGKQRETAGPVLSDVRGIQLYQHLQSSVINTLHLVCLISQQTRTKKNPTICLSILQFVCLSALCCRIFGYETVCERLPFAHSRSVIRLLSHRWLYFGSISYFSSAVRVEDADAELSFVFGADVFLAFLRTLCVSGFCKVF